MGNCHTACGSKDGIQTALLSRTKVAYFTLRLDGKSLTGLSLKWEISPNLLDKIYTLGQKRFSSVRSRGHILGLSDGGGGCFTHHLFVSSLCIT